MVRSIGLCSSAFLLLACGATHPAATAPDSADGGNGGGVGANGTGGVAAVGVATTSTGGTSAAGGATTAAWRPFSDDSPWNTLIGSNPTLDPDSTALIADWQTSSPYGQHLDVNIKGAACKTPGLRRAR
jgi:hypothetical protein